MTAHAPTDDRGNFSSLGDSEFAIVRDLLANSAGIIFDEKRREVLRLHVRDRALARGCRSFGEYAELLKSSPASELQALWNQVAIHQTEFFRNRPQYEGLALKVLPEVREVATRSDKSLTLWSAGCSSGEEPYSLAISVLEALGSEAASWRIKIHATDIATDILETAAAARYDERHMEGVSAELRRRYFDFVDGFFVVKPLVRDLVHFSPHNLSLDPPPSPGACDIVFCCNVTIYFTTAALHSAIATLEDSLRPGGFLFLGHSESLWRQPHHLELIDLGDSFVYRKEYSAPFGEGIKVLEPAAVRQSDVLARKAAEHGARRAEPTELPKYRSPLESPPSAEPRPLSNLGAGGRFRPVSKPVDAADEFWLEEAAPPDAAIEIGETRDESLSYDDSPLAHSEVVEIIATVQGHLERGEVDAALALATSALGRAPTEAPLHFLLGSAQQRLGMHPEALGSFDKATYCDQTFSLAYFYRAVVFEEEGDLAAAVRDYQNAARWLEADHDGKWDPYLEAMSHNTLLDLCRSKAASLEARTRGSR